MIVKETVHHGTYHNVREVEVDPTDHNEVSHMIRMCPYSTGKNLTPAGFTALVERISKALTSGELYSHGWVRWEVS